MAVRPDASGEYPYAERGHKLADILQLFGVDGDNPQQMQRMFKRVYKEYYGNGNELSDEQAESCYELFKGTKELPASVLNIYVKRAGRVPEHLAEPLRAP